MIEAEECRRKVVWWDSEWYMIYLTVAGVFEEDAGDQIKWNVIIKKPTDYSYDSVG